MHSTWCRDRQDSIRCDSAKKIAFWATSATRYLQQAYRATEFENIAICIGTCLIKEHQMAQSRECKRLQSCDYGVSGTSLGQKFHLITIQMLSIAAAGP
jgi:hypothetical protein